VAQTVGTAFVDIRANTTNFEKQLESSVGASLKSAQGAAQNFGKASNESLMSISRNLTDVGKNLSKKVTLPLVAIGTGALITAGNFEQGMNKVKAITGSTEVDIKQLSNQAKELGASTKFSATEAANAMSFLGMAGFDTSQIIGAMPSTLQLAAAANMGLAEAADITSNVLSGFGIEVSELGSVNDTLVKTLTRTNTDLSQLGQAFKFVGPVAKGAGISFNETSAAIGLLGNAGIQAGMAGTSLRGAITALLNPSKQVSDVMMSLGLNVKDANGELLPLNQIIQQLESSGASTGEMMQIFGQRAGPAMMALVEQGSDALRNLTNELEASGGTAQRIADIQMEGLNGQMTSLKSAVEGLMIAIGESGLLQAMTRFAGFITDIARAMTNVNPALLTAATAMGALAAAAGPMLVISGSLIRNFVSVRQALVALRQTTIATTIAMGALKTVLIGVPLLAIAAGMMTLINRFKDGRRRAEEFAAGVKTISDRMGQGETATDVATDRLKEFINQSPRLQQALSKSSFGFEQFVTAAGTDMDRFKEMTDELLTNYGETFVGTIAYHNGVLASNVKETIDGFRTDLTMLGDGLAAGAAEFEFWEQESQRSLLLTAQGFEALGDLSVEALQAMADAATREALQTEAAMSIIGTAAEMAALEVESELGKIEKAADDLRREVDQAMSAAASSFLKLSDDGKKSIDSFIRETLEGAARLSMFQDNVTTIAAATSGEFANYMLSMGVDVEDLVRQMADPKKAADLENAFKAWEIKTSVMSENMADRFAAVDPEFKKILDGIAGMTDRELQEIRDIAERRALEIGTAMMQGQVQGIAANSGLVQDAIRNAIRQAISAAVSEAGIESPSKVMAEQVGLPMAQGVAVGIEDGAGEIDAAMRRTIQQALVKAAEELSNRIDQISDRASGSFLKLSKNGQSSVDDFVSETIDASKRLSGFQNNVLQIAELTSGEFGLYLLEMGADAEELVRDLSDPAKVGALDQAYAAWRDSTRVGSRNMVAEFAKVDPAFAEVLKNLNLTIDQEVKPAIETARRGGNSAGSGLVSGAIAGIDSRIPALRAKIAEYEAILQRVETAKAPASPGVGFPALGDVSPEGLASRGLVSLVSINSATFNNGTDAQAVAQQISASLGAMIPT
jgi:TP901 family phage tail tape measure protein